MRLYELYDGAVMSLFANIFHAIDIFSHHTEITQMSMVLVVVVIVSGLLNMLKQPAIIGYLVAGILLGPVALGIVGGAEIDHGGSFVQLFAHLGIALLLFMVGLELSISTIREHGKSALLVGGMQIVLTCLLAFVLSRFLGYDMWTAGYIGLAVSFSSTIIIIKLLTDKRENESVYGKMSIGILIVQDLVVMLALMILSISGQSIDGGQGVMIVESLMLLVVFIVFALRVLPPVMNRFAKSPEYLLLIGMCRCLLVGGMFLRTGFSFEIGCLLAGMSLSVSPYRQEMANRLKSLRDFFLVLFFIQIGLQLSFESIRFHVRAIVILSLFVVCVKPLLVYGIMRRFTYTHKVSLKTSFSLGQISEFSFLLIAMGISTGHVVDEGMLSVIMSVGLISFVLSSYGIVYNEDIYKLGKKLFGEHDRMAVDENEVPEKVDVLLFGYGRMGGIISHILDQKELSHLIIDHNPLVFQNLKGTSKKHVYADATNQEVYHDYLGGGTSMIISTIPDFNDNREIVRIIKEFDAQSMVVVVAGSTKEALALYDHGADYVIIPSHLSAHHMGYMIEDRQQNLTTLIEHKEHHLLQIQQYHF